MTEPFEKPTRLDLKWIIERKVRNMNPEKYEVGRTAQKGIGIAIIGIASGFIADAIMPVIAGNPDITRENVIVVLTGLLMGLYYSLKNWIKNRNKG